MYNSRYHNYGDIYISFVVSTKMLNELNFTRRWGTLTPFDYILPLLSHTIPVYIVLCDYNYLTPKFSFNRASPS